MTYDTAPSPTSPTRVTYAAAPQTLDVLLRAALPILLAAALAGIGAFLLTASRPKVFEASSSLLTSSSAPAQLNDSLVMASPLPAGALDAALRSPVVVRNVIAQVEASGLPEAVRRDTADRLRRELTTSSFSTLDVQGSGQASEDGVFQLHARASTPAAARVLANAAAGALMTWDIGRIQQRMARAAISIKGQLAALAQNTPDADIYSEPYQVARASLLKEMALVGAMGKSASPTLDVIAEAVDPSAPIAPRPLRSALISALLALVLGTGLALLLANLGRPAPAPATR